jgi:hypothetical protein
MILPPVTATAEQIMALHQKHIDLPNYGAMGTRFAPLVRAFAKEIGARTALDYACGKGQLADALLAEGAFASIHKFEIGIPAFRAPCPEPVDLAICNHALYEFKPDGFVASVAYLRAISTRGGFISFQWGGDGQGCRHESRGMQDADWVYATLRQYWPCHRLLDSGPLAVPAQRQFAFMGFVVRPRWI